MGDARKVTLAQLRAAAKKAGCTELREWKRWEARDESSWYCEAIADAHSSYVSVAATSKQRARKLMLRVLEGLADV